MFGRNLHKSWQEFDFSKSCMGVAGCDLKFSIFGDMTK